MNMFQFNIKIFHLVSLWINFGLIFTLSVYNDRSNSQTVTYDSTFFNEPYEQELHRFRREVGADNVAVRINKLNDTHQQLIVHWVGEESNVNTNIIICLAKNSKDNLKGNVPSAVYYSYDYGDTYLNKTELFKIKNTYAQLDKFYIHPKYMNHTIFLDSTNKALFITENHGFTFRTIKVDFTPNDIVFHPTSSKTWLVYDKTNSSKILWLTQDNGESFSVFQMYIKAFDWFSFGNADGKNLILQRELPDGSTMIFRVVSTFAMNFDNYVLKGLLYGVVDLYVKGNFIFATKNDSKILDLYVKYKNSTFMKAKFDTDLPAKDYHVADIVENRIFVVVGHSENLSNLYVSQLVNENMSEIHFSLSLERIFCYFPNVTWRGSLISGMSDVTFVDIHRVEGMRGIYIASQVVPTANTSLISPEDLVTRITFDWGVKWRPLNLTKQLSGDPCLLEKGCSLHVTQKFALWYPTTRYTPILSSQSAPGLIIATGTVGKTMKGPASVYMSRDAGITWKQVLNDNYYFNFGDHGGIIVAVKFFKVKEEISTILYSTDEGETWNTHKMATSPLRIYSLMTEPGENTTVFSLFGSATGAHQWIIIKADFRLVFDANCTESDYKEWSPKHPEETKTNCLLGKYLRFSKRIPTRNCYNGRNYQRVVKSEICPCDVYDFTCDQGFYWNTNTSHCVRNKTMDINPYAVPSICIPFRYYKRTKGYVKIPGDECEGGTINYLPDLFPCPIMEKEKETMLLLAQKDRIMTFSLLDNSSAVQLPITGLQNVIAVEYDSKSNCVFYADIVADVISMWCFQDGLPPQKLVDVQLQSVEGMAFDWVSKHLYFVDGVLAKIEVIRTDLNGTRFRKTVVNNTIAKKPRGIAVHPMAGYMFWTDWASGSPSINRANLDGSAVLKLFTSPVVEWPNGITIDFIAERIYWVDAKEDYIASADLQGHGFKKILEKNDKVSHPFSVAVFKDDMYWDDWKQNSILAADKDTGIGIRLIKEQLPGLMDLKIYGPTIQEGQNTCFKNNACSHLCFGLPDDKFACGCPDELILVNGTKCVCPGGKEPINKETCLPVDNTCGPNSFQCNNSNCIAKILKCDGDDDCGDRSDENCVDATTCSPNLFRCGSSGKCIPLFWKCDNDYDCADRSDEKDCPYGPCKEGHFACDNKRCVPNKWRCDGEDDCHDGSDEKNCTNTKIRSCSPDEFVCGGVELTCIPMAWKCDNERDCPDGLDEINCTTPCADGYFTCANKKCILSSWKCDGESDCGDGSDEFNCTEIVSPPGYTDEIDPANTGECKSWMFECSDKKCIPYWWKCDSVNDCGDNSDEIGCTKNINDPGTTTLPTTSSKSVCPAHEFRCRDGSCIADAWVCDGHDDCSTGDDEVNCNHTNKCRPDHSEFRCRTSGICIPVHLVCDGISQCPDGSDEGLCNHTLKPIPLTPCNYGNFSCDNRRCLPLYKKCDGIYQCLDRTDEENCSSIYNKTFQVVNLEVFQTNENSAHVAWTVQPSYKDGMKYLPSIKINNTWRNESWITRRDYMFTKLSPYTTYTVTVYVGNEFINKEYPPAYFFNVTTLNGEPSAPLDVIVVKKNTSYIEVKWSPPLISNGQIHTYTIFLSPPVPALSLSVHMVRTSATLYYDFEPNKEYTVTVTASNDLHESVQSVPVKFKFYPADLVGIQNLKVDKKTENSVTLSWKKTNVSGDYYILTRVKPPYPAMSTLIAKETTFTVTDLSPGVRYTFEVGLAGSTSAGNSASVVVETEGVQLPSILNLQGSLVQDIVKLSWDAPKEKRKTSWKYGIYYGVTMQELFQSPKNITESTNYAVTGLNHCTLYTFGVGVVLLNSYGPIFNKFVTILTEPDLEAELNLNVAVDPANDTNFIMTWKSSCPKMINPVGYALIIEELASRVKTRINIPETKNTSLQQTYAGHYGAKYKITLYTVDDKRVLANTEFQIPPCPPPHQVIVYQVNAGYVVMWDVRNESPTLASKKYRFEVLANEGNHIDRQRAKSYFTDNPPIVISNLKDGEAYTFAVRIVSDNGDQSMLSEEYTVENKFHNEPYEHNTKSENSTSFTWFIVFLVAMVGSGAAFGYWKNKRSHMNFKNLANSHYNTRSGSTTFTGVNGLDLEDSPDIREHFSDDEPLVIA